MISEHCEELGISTVTCSARVGTKTSLSNLTTWHISNIDLVALKSISDEIYIALTDFVPGEKS
jgi:hypothetical protein